ncbi:nucleotidyltransferase family protein [Acetivibrio clariflavus DSM 19732]|uniref:Nucleotidyltransferase family protein n=2 Tax=Acetivibrio clariflavus TaxID=288965 RepID=G8LSJ1_ACECE|nr:nucleotidyltransferase family protein [Acetivibrio clariflavus DSM 19732]
MRAMSVSNDRVLNRVTQIFEKCSQQVGVDIVSVVLYGSRAKGDYTSQSDYEFLILVEDNTDLLRFILMNDTIKYELLKERLMNVKILMYTPHVFEELLYTDKLVGTFLYMICRDNIPLFDRKGTFRSIKERLTSDNNTRKSEEEFLVQCIDFSRQMGSEKWERKWDRILLQFRYQKRRKSAY